MELIPSSTAIFCVSRAHFTWDIQWEMLGERRVSLAGVGAWRYHQGASSSMVQKGWAFEGCQPGPSLKSLPSPTPSCVPGEEPPHSWTRQWTAFPAQTPSRGQTPPSTGWLLATAEFPYQESSVIFLHIRCHNSSFPSSVSFSTSWLHYRLLR